MSNIISLPTVEETAYIKIKASYKYNKDRLYRTILVKPHTNLVDLGAILCAVFGSQLEHPYMFYTKYANYVPRLLMDDEADSCCMEDFALDDLDDTFTFHYDFGEDWSFTCRKYKRESILQDTRTVILLDGKGQGIWEDNRDGLDAYLSGMVDPDSIEPDENLGVYPPWNMKFTKYSDFDLPLDISALQIILDNSIDDIISECRESMISDDEDEDQTEVSEVVFSIIASAVETQVQNVPYVTQTFQRLKRVYDENTAYGMIAQVLTDEVSAVLMQERPYSTELYKQRLKQLK